MNGNSYIHQILKNETVQNVRLTRCVT